MINFNVDIGEMETAAYDEHLLDVLLIDRSKSLSLNKTCNIVWATDNYASLGSGYQIDDPISLDNIINEWGLVIQKGGVSVFRYTLFFLILRITCNTFPSVRPPLRRPILWLWRSWHMLPCSVSASPDSSPTCGRRLLLSDQL